MCNTDLVFSPLFVNAFLSLIAAGSAGQTLDQILSFLRSNSANELHYVSSQLVSFVLSDGGPVGNPNLSFAKGVWVERSLLLKEPFKQVVIGVYNALLESVDFRNKADEVRNQVNSWAGKETRCLITEVLPPGSVDSSTRLILANALYFKGAWYEKFDVSKTKDYNFSLLNGSSVQVPFMTSKTTKRIAEFYEFKVLALPYKQGEDKKRGFTMYFFLPNQKEGLISLMEKLVTENDFLNRHVPNVAVEVGDFRIPRFKFGFGFEASNTLKALGLSLPFSKGGITEMAHAHTPLDENLCVSNIFHRSFIEVNEEGTEAAAVTGGAVCTITCVQRTGKMDFVADHPFLFVIREDITCVVLFIGQLLNPQQP